MAGKLDPNATGNYNSVVGHVKNTERSQWMIRRIVQKGHQLSAESVAKELYMTFRSAQERSIQSFM